MFGSPININILGLHMDYIRIKDYKKTENIFKPTPV